MKAIIRNLLSATCLVAFAFVVNAQTIRIANSNPGATGGANVYTGTNAINLAIAASSSGDIIHVIPSSVKYDNVTIDRSGISIYGIGTNPSKEGGKSSYCDYIYITDGATAGTITSTVIAGMNVFYYIYITNNSNDIVTGVLIENCFLGSIQMLSGNASNIAIRSNIFDNYVSTERINIAFNKSANVSITNNILVLNNNVAYYAVSGNNGIMVANNLFVGEGAASEMGFGGFDGGVVKNNIFLRVIPQNGTGTLSNNTFLNNIVSGASNNTFSTANGNTSTNDLVVADPLTLVNSVPATDNWDFTYDPGLPVGSPALSYGDDGLNGGQTGGAVPFNDGGTNLPLVESVNIPSTIIQGDNLNTNVKAKGN